MHPRGKKPIAGELFMLLEAPLASSLDWMLAAAPEIDANFVIRVVSRIFHILAAIVIGVLFGCVFALVYPHGLFSKPPTPQNRTFSKSQVLIILPMSFLLFLNY